MVCRYIDVYHQKKVKWVMYLRVLHYFTLQNDVFQLSNWLIKRYIPFGVIILCKLCIDDDCFFALRLNDLNQIFVLLIMWQTVPYIKSHFIINAKLLKLIINCHQLFFPSFKEYILPCFAGHTSACKIVTL